jgi:hypothetical protein
MERALRTIVIAAAAFASAASAAGARPGDEAHPIVLKMPGGADSITVKGVLRQNVDCCAYRFKAHAGQQLLWTESGAAARMGLAYPNGDGIDPGLPNPASLPQTGAYLLTVRPDLMAEGAFGRFTLKLRIPPAR